MHSIKKPKNIRQHNEKLMLNLFMEYRHLTVPLISKRLGLSRTTIFNINEQFVESGLVRTVGKGASTDTGGKRPVQYSLNPEYGYSLCFYIGYSTIEVILFNLCREEVWSQQTKIARNSDIDSIGAVMHTQFISMKQIFKDINLIGISVAVHGLINPKTGVCVHAIYFPSWGVNVSLKEKLWKYLDENTPLYINSWLWFKTQIVHIDYPELKDVDSFVLINAGRHGVVAGVHSYGLINGETPRFVAELGHMNVNPLDTVRCQCGGYGCVESLTNLDRIVDNARQKRSQYPDSSIFDTETFSFGDLIRAFKDNDPLALELLEEAAMWIAIAISNLNLILFPNIIILEGDYCLAGEEWHKMVETRLEAVSLVRFKNKINIKFRDPHDSDILEGAAHHTTTQYFAQDSILKR